MEAETACTKCRYELTCGYSMLAQTGERDETSERPCSLGLMSSGIPFFQPRETAALAAA